MTSVDGAGWFPGLSDEYEGRGERSTRVHRRLATLNQYGKSGSYSAGKHITATMAVVAHILDASLAGHS